MEALQLGPHAGPGAAGGDLDGADEQQGQPAEQHVGADAVLAAVVDRAQGDDLLHVSPAAFDRQELLVASGDVLGRELGGGGAGEEIAVEAGPRGGRPGGGGAAAPRGGGWGTGAGRGGGGGGP